MVVLVTWLLVTKLNSIDYRIFPSLQKVLLQRYIVATMETELFKTYLGSKNTFWVSSLNILELVQVNKANKEITVGDIYYIPIKCQAQC